MSHRPTRTIALLVLAAASAAGARPIAASGADDRFVLVERDLRQRVVRDVAVDGEQVRFGDENGLPGSVALGGCIALVRLDRAVAPRRLSMVTLVDGRRLPGKPAVRTPSRDDAFTWTHPWLGIVELGLDETSEIRMDPEAPALPEGPLDQVLLRNGDRLEGFVASVGDPIVLEREGAPGTAPEMLEIPLDRVAAVRFVAARRGAEGRRLWLRDGTIVDARQVRVGDDGYLRLDSDWAEDGRPVQIPLEAVDALVLDAAAVVPLAALPAPTLDCPVPRFRLPAPRLLDDDAPLGAGPLELRGPIVAAWPLPAGATRVAFLARIPETSRPWADLELIVRDGDRVVFAQTLDGANPEAFVRADLAGRTLSIELREGANGPIQDRVRLERALVLVAR